MKISEMSTSQAASALVRLSGPLSRLMKDGKLKEILQGLANHEGDKDFFEAIADVVDTAVPMLFGEHLADTLTVVSVMCNKPIKAVEAQGIMTTIAEIYDFAQDKEFVDFLGSLKKSKGQTAAE